jgi:hypothetical protein
MNMGKLGFMDWSLIAQTATLLTIGIGCVALSYWAYPHNYER